MKESAWIEFEGEKIFPATFEIKQDTIYLYYKNGDPRLRKTINHMQKGNQIHFEITQKLKDCNPNLKYFKIRIRDKTT